MHNNKNTRPPQVTELLRILVGGYLVYLAWEIWQGKPENSLLLVAAALFAVVGAGLVILCGKSLITSEYFRMKPEEEEKPEDPEALPEK